MKDFFRVYLYIIIFDENRDTKRGNKEEVCREAKGLIFAFVSSNYVEKSNLA
jgi:hypothetical protein